MFIIQLNQLTVEIIEMNLRWLGFALGRLVWYWGKKIEKNQNQIKADWFCLFDW